MGAVWATDPEVAVMVMGYVPAGVLGLPLPRRRLASRAAGDEQKSKTGVGER